MKILKCRRQCICVALEYAEIVINISISDKCNQDSLTKLFPNYPVPADCCNTSLFSILWDWAWMRVFNLNSPMHNFLLLLSFPVKVIRFMYLLIS